MNNDKNKKTQILLIIAAVIQIVLLKVTIDSAAASRFERATLSEAALDFKTIMSYAGPVLMIPSFVYEWFYIFKRDKANRIAERIIPSKDTLSEATSKEALENKAEGLKYAVRGNKSKICACLLIIYVVAALLFMIVGVNGFYGVSGLILYHAILALPVFPIILIAISLRYLICRIKGSSFSVKIPEKENIRPDPNTQLRLLLVIAVVIQILLMVRLADSVRWFMTEYSADLSFIKNASGHLLFMLMLTIPSYVYEFMFIVRRDKLYTLSKKHPMTAPVFFYRLSWLIQIAYILGGIYSMTAGLDFMFSTSYGLEALVLYHIELGTTVIPALLVIGSLIYIIRYHKKKKKPAAQAKKVTHKTDDNNDAAV